MQLISDSHLLRSLLCVPASNAKALAKSSTLDCDAIIFDLEDAVAPQAKAAARDALAAHFQQTPSGHAMRMIRINGYDTPWGHEDMKSVVAIAPDVVLVPKVESPEDIHRVDDLLDSADNTTTRIWAMIETPKGVLNAAAIARAAHTPDARLDGFIVGANDLRKATRVPFNTDRSPLHPWLMQILLAARAYGLSAIDAVSNNFKDMVFFAEECAEGRRLGFDGKMLIHPAQIEAANAAFGPSETELHEARKIVEAFAAPEADGQGAININGTMVERLHLDEAVQMLERVRLIKERKTP